MEALNYTERILLYMAESYWCLKCEREHRISSAIGAWHKQLRPPELEPSGHVGVEVRERPPKDVFAAGVALAIALEGRTGECTYEKYERVYENEDFEQYGSAESALRGLREDYNDAVVRRHSGEKWVGFEASGLDSMKLENTAKNYLTIGHRYGSRSKLDW